MKHISKDILFVAMLFAAVMMAAQPAHAQGSLSPRMRLAAPLNEAEKDVAQILTQLAAVDGPLSDESGTVVKWAFEGAVPNQLYRRGVTPAVLKPGLQITIKGHPARDASRHFGEVHEVVLQDGRSFVIGASGTGPPTLP